MQGRFDGWAACQSIFEAPSPRDSAWTARTYELLRRSRLGKLVGSSRQIADLAEDFHDYDQFMSWDRRAKLLVIARLWAYPLWFAAHSESADAVNEDIDWWMRCINDEKLLVMDQYSRFAYLAGALPEFRNLVHYRLRSAPAVRRVLLRALYRPEPTLTLDSKSIGPGFFIQHGFATVVYAETIGSHCWINQQVTIGYDTRGKPTLGDDVRVGAGAMVIGRLTLHDGATVGVNATVINDVGPGETVVAPLAVSLKRRYGDDDEPT